MARVLGTAWREKCLSGFFFFFLLWRITAWMWITARKNVVVTQSLSLICAAQRRASPRECSLST